MEQATRSLRPMVRQLAAQVGNLRAAFGNASEPYVVLDRGFVIVAASDSFCRSANIEREDLLGRHVCDVFPKIHIRQVSPAPPSPSRRKLDRAGQPLSAPAGGWGSFP